MRTSPALLACTALLLAAPAAAAPAAPAAARPAPPPAAAPSTAGLPAPFIDPVYVLGSPKAPVTVVEYLSAGCTHCAEFDAKEFPALKARYVDTGKVRWEVRELLAGPVQLAAAGFVLARCTGRDRYWTTLEGVFRAQEAIFRTGDLRSGLLGVAHGAGLTDKQFDSCMGDDKAFAAADARSEASAKAGVNLTPTFMLNGRKFDTHAVTAADIDRALAAAPKRQAGR